MTDTRLRRAGLDYKNLVHVNIHESLTEALIGSAPERVFAFSTKGNRNYSEITYRKGDVLLFGPETRGLPDDIRAQYTDTLLRIPMKRETRSLNLANAVAIALYEGWRQLGFESAT